VKALTAAASNALSPDQPLCATSRKAAEEVSRVVIGRMAEKVMPEPFDALLQASRELVVIVPDYCQQRQKRKRQYRA